VRIAVTGATGFVGRHVCTRLTARGHDVTALVRRASTAPVGTREVALGDLDGSAVPSAALGRLDAVVHLAARVHVMRDRSADPLAEFRRVNVDGTLALARAAVAAGVPRFVFVSSVKVLGEETGGDSPAFRVGDPAAPVDPYGISKHEAEQALHALADATGLEVAVVRPPLVHGPGVGGNVARIARLVRAGAPLPLGSVDNARTMVSVRTLAAVLEGAAVSHDAAGATVLAADSRAFSSATLARLLGEGLGRPARLVPVPPALLRAAGRATGRLGDVDRLTSSLRVEPGSSTAFSWAEESDPADELRATGAWFRSPTDAPASSPRADAPTPRGGAA
jgi:nucleoside-diphosphate-sugar epimerase